jgi:ABC-type glutathione transport system ATPase component
MTERADDPVGTYSGGMKRRINLAVGLVNRPRVFFLDEPTVGVDPQSRNHIFESVERLNQEQGMAILYTTHYMEEAERLCRRVGIIDMSEIIALDTPKNLTESLGGGIIQVGMAEADERLRAAVEGQPAVSAARFILPVDEQEDDSIGSAPSRVLLHVESLHANAALVRTEGQAGSVADLVVISMAVVSGAMFPSIRIDPLQYLTPHYWAIQGFQDIITRNLGPADVANEVAILLGMAAIFFAVGVSRFRFD